jgi:hypothetical protein
MGLLIGGDFIHGRLLATSATIVPSGPAATGGDTDTSESGADGRPAVAALPKSQTMTRSAADALIARRIQEQRDRYDRRMANQHTQGRLSAEMPAELPALPPGVPPPPEAVSDAVDGHSIGGVQ